MNPETLFDEALTHIESEDVRAWARANRDVWLQIASNAMVRAAAAGKPQLDATRFATFILVQAMGL